MKLWALLFMITKVYEGVYADQICSEFVKFDETVSLKIGYFNVTSGRANSFLHLTAFVSEACQENLCDIQLDSDAETEDRFRTRRPLRFSINFHAASSNARIVGIVLRNSTRCHVICRQNLEILDDTVKSLELTYYPYGREESIEALCNAVDTFQPSRRPVESCGGRSSIYDLTSLTIGGEVVPKGFWPWLVAIYHLNSNSFEFKCGATLIGRRAILTAAHCLYDDYDRPLPPERILVQFGRHNLSLFHEDGSLQYHAHIIVSHPEYESSQLSRESDIALIIVNRDVEYSPFIKPACIWEEDDRIDSVTNQTGVVVGWGTDETRRPTPVPRRVYAKITSHDNCTKSDASFTTIVTKRNFCAGNLDGTGPCQGDSGGAFMLNVSGRWIVRGIISASIGDIARLCNLYKYVVYTDVAKYRGWLVSQLPRTSVPVINIFSSVAASYVDDVRQKNNTVHLGENVDNLECGTIAPQFRIIPLIYKGFRVSKGTWPWLATIFQVLHSKILEYACGGTIISNKAILTASLCIKNHLGVYEVVVGRYNFIDYTEGQVLRVEQIISHPERKPDRFSLETTLTILKVEGTIRFNDLVRPACLWESSSDSESVVGRIGQIAGYGTTENSSISDLPVQLTSEIISRDMCENKNLPLQQRLTKNIFCTGITNESSLCPGDAGNGFMLNETNKWTLRGVAFGKHSKTCFENGISIYVDVVNYQSWINENLSKF